MNRTIILAFLLAALLLPMAARAETVTISSAERLQASVELGAQTRTGEAFLLKPKDQIRLLPLEIDRLQQDPHGGTFKPFKLSKPEVFELNILWTAKWSVPTGEVLNLTERELLWRAPEFPGTYVIDAELSFKQGFDHVPEYLQPALGSHRASNAKAVFFLLLMYPYDRNGDGLIETYPLGIYPNEEDELVKPYVAARRDRYRPPKWFVKVDSETARLKVSPHFQLIDFVTDRRTDGAPVFIALDYRLIDRLEEIVAGLEKLGQPVKTLNVFRGYISPNHAQRLRRAGADFTEFTRHLYGDAAAFFIDADGDGQMDDLNKDGKIDKEDGGVIIEMVREISKESGKYGGVGVSSGQTDPTTPKTPYVEIDMRGEWASWGL